MIKKGYRQSVSFYDKEKDRVFFREIIYPMKESPNNIFKYILNSIPSIKVICVDKKEECLYFVSGKSYLSEEISKIDEYWLDGEIYLIDYEKNSQRTYIKIVTDSEYTKRELNELINNLLENSKIYFIDKLNDCWIKRKG